MFAFTQVPPTQFPQIVWSDYKEAPKHIIYNNYAKETFLRLLDTDLPSLTEILFGTVMSPDFEEICQLAETVDYTTSNTISRVICMLANSSIKRIIILDAYAHHERIFKLRPFCFDTYTQSYIQFTDQGPFDPEHYTFYAQSEFNAQVLFSTSHDVNINHSFGNGLQRSIVGAFTQVCDSFLTSSPFWTQCLSTIAKAIIIYRHKSDLITVSTVFVDLLLTWRVTYEVAHLVWESIKDHVDTLLRYFRDDDFVGQVYDDGTIKSLVMLITSVLAVVGTTKLPAQALMDLVLRRTSNLGRACQGMGSILDVFKFVFNDIYDIVYTFMYGVSPQDKDLSQFLIDLETWFTEVSELTSIKNRDNMSNSYAHVRRVERAYRKGQDYCRQLDTLKVETREKEPFMQYWRMMTGVYEKCVQHGARKTEPRTEPVIISLFGASGVGKTGLVYLLAQDLLSLEDMVDCYYNETYFRSVEQEFWDGYSGQTVVVYDDFGQMRDMPGVPNKEFMEIIRVGNLAQFPLHMAHLEEKAKTKFTSRACIMTSNAPKYNIQSLTHSAAFDRRIDLQVCVTLDPKYCDLSNRLDPSTLPSGLSTLPYRFQVFVDGRGDANKVGLPNYLNYSEFSSLCCKLYLNKKTNSQAQIDSLALRAKEISTPKFVDCAEYTGQVSDPTLDQVVFPLLWLQYQYREAQEHTIHPILNPEHIKELALIARSCSDYTEFLNQGQSWCMEKGIEIFSPCTDSGLWSQATEWTRTIYTNGMERAKYSADIVKQRCNIVLERTKAMFVHHLSALNMQNFPFKIFGACIAGALAVFGMYKVTSKITTGKPEIYASRVVGFPTYITESKPKPSKLPRNAFMTESKPKPSKNSKDSFFVEAASDYNAQEIINTSISKNVYLLWTRKDSDWIPRVNIMFIRGKCALMVDHATSFLQNCDVMLTNPYNQQGLVVLKDTIKIVPITTERNVDCVVLVFPRNIASHSDIVKHFVTTTDISKFRNICGTLYCVSPLSGKDKIVVGEKYELLDIEAKDSQDYRAPTSDGQSREYMLRHGYIYTAQTRSGNCSGPIVISAHALARKIIGIHIAGSSSGRALAQSITQGMLIKTLESKEIKFDAQIAWDISDLGCVNEDIEPLLPEGDFIPIGCLAKPVLGAFKTTLRRSPLYAKIVSPTTKPAHLKPYIKDGTMFDPLITGLRKCGVVCPPLDEQMLRRCKDSVLSILKRKTNPLHKRIMTYDESIMGVEGDMFIKPINRQSSPGFPWTQTKQGTGKTKWLGIDEYILDHPELLTAVNMREKKAKQNIRLPTLWTDTLKDERRPINKVDEGKTRVFSAGSMDYILSVRKYFLGFNAHLMHNRIENEVAVGINPFGLDWHLLALHLQKKGSKVIAGDFSNFDGSLNAQVLYIIRDLINEWYNGSDEETRVRNVLFEDLVNSIHIHRDNIYQWTHSQPSGNPLTTVLNSLYNSITMRYVFLLCMPEGQRSLSIFDKYVSLISYGDDNCVNISDAIIDHFNQVTITSAYKQMGMTYTDEAKTGVIIPFRSLSEINFLKRKFTYSNTLKRYEAPLDLDVVLEMCMWVHGDLDHDRLCASNCNTAYEELSLHPIDIFETWTSTITNLTHQYLKEQPILYNYQDYKEMDLSKYY